ncbi:TonB-dependent receptor [Pinirhizobacter sp.]|jgi:outer membrane receptor for ferrienterochelin and colicin|uniref:TonB-dependent receptor n=1 Tax=Pinirhizobacter sp. TaxID=2950432 RepID=UPI002F43016F
MSTAVKFRRKILASVIAASVTAIAIAPTVGFAQTATANLRGKAAPGSTVTVKNPNTGLTRRATVNADGSYSIIGLPPATYTVDAGPGTEKQVTLTVASTATLNLTAEAAAPAAANATSLQGVTVSASTLNEVKTPEVGQTISLHQIQTIPQVSRNFLEFADTVPGMAFNVDSAGHTSLRGGAMNNSSVNVFIDGVGQKSYVKEGGVSGQVNSQGNPFPQLAIGQYKVITTNYKAEYDQVSSAAVTAETKSGTNEFHGEVFDTYTSDKYRSRTAGEEAPGADKAKSFEKEYGFALGGPIIKDQMHFFIAYEEKKFDTPITVTPGSGSPDTINSLLPSSVASQFGPADLPFTEKLYFGKIDWELTDRDRIEISTQVRREDQADNIGSAQARSASIVTENHDTRGLFRWQHSGDWYFNELNATYENSSNNPTPLNFGNGAVYTYQPANDSTILGVGAAGPLATQVKGQEGPSLSDDFTFNDLSWHGDHTIKIGWKYKEVTLHAQDAGDVNPLFYYDVDDAGTHALPYKVQFSNPVAGLDPISETKSKQYGGYAQDDWAITDKLTLNLGVRWDYEKTPSYLDHVTPDNVIAAFNMPDPAAQGQFPGQTYAQTLAKGGVNINDYISNGHNRHAYNKEWQPRLGMSYDLFGDEAHVIHAGAGRSYDRNLYDYLQLEQTKSAIPIQEVFFNVPERPCSTTAANCLNWNPIYLNGLQNLQSQFASTNAGQEIDVLNNKLKAPYSDQYSLGMSNQLGDWQTDATVTRVLSYDGFAFTLGNRYPDGSFFQGGGQPWGNGVPGFGSLIIGNNGIRTRTTQVLLSASKPYTKESGWSSTFAYTYTRAYQNRDINEHYSFDEETIGNYPFILSNAAPKHRFVTTGSIDGPWGFSFSAKLTLATPTPYNAIANYGAIGPNGEAGIPTTFIPRGGSKFLVGGNIWGYRDIDFQATKDFKIWGDVSAYMRFDILNVFNWKNFDDAAVLTSFGSSGTLPTNPVAYDKHGNITFVPRTAKFTVGVKF